MTTYSREYLRGLKKAEEMMQYNNKVNQIVTNISNAIIFSASRGSTELTLDTVVVSDIEMIHKVIDKVKVQFFDSDIEYVESKKLRDNLLQCVIRVNWNEITLENIESHTQKQIQDENVKNGLARCANELKDKSIEKWKNNYIESRTQKEIQDENIKNGLARRKRIVEETSNKIKELEEQIAVKKDLINKLTGNYYRLLF